VSSFETFVFYSGNTTRLDFVTINLEGFAKNIHRNAELSLSNEEKKKNLGETQRQLSASLR
jgi:hypothetical protein